MVDNEFKEKSGKKIKRTIKALALSAALAGTVFHQEKGNLNHVVMYLGKLDDGKEYMDDGKEYMIDCSIRGVIVRPDTNYPVGIRLDRFSTNELGNVKEFAKDINTKETKHEGAFTIELPEGLGKVKSYEAWDYPRGNVESEWAHGTGQYRLWKEADGLNSFDSNGFGVVNGSYVVAVTTTFGKVGDFIQVELEDGTIIPCIIGDIKSQMDPGCNKYGHRNGQSVIEFMVQTKECYNKGYSDISNKFKQEWKNAVVRITNTGVNYFENPEYINLSKETEKTEKDMKLTFEEFQR